MDNDDVELDEQSPYTRCNLASGSRVKMIIQHLGLQNICPTSSQNPINMSDSDGSSLSGNPSDDKPTIQVGANWA